MNENDHPVDTQNDPVADKTSALKQGLFIGALILVSSIFTLSLYCLLDNNQNQKTYQSGYDAGYSSGYDAGYNNGYDDEYGQKAEEKTSSDSNINAFLEFEGSVSSKTDTSVTSTSYYVLNTSTKKIHKPSCAWVDQISSENYQESTQSISELENSGYTTCGHCF